MTSGIDIVVPFTGDPDPTLPYASDKDRSITPGSLFLFEPTHTFGAMPSGTAYGAVPNVAWEECAALIGTGDATTLAGTFTGSAVDPTKGVFERTAKGGLHCILSAAARGGWVAGVELPAALYNWWLSGSNKSRAHVLYVWAHTTRATGASTGNLIHRAIVNMTGAPSNNLGVYGSTNSLGPDRSSASLPTGWNGSPNATLANNRGGYFFGNSPPYNSLNSAAGISKALYRYHLIDVPASGKTLAQLDAEELAHYTEAFGAGGRFASDTWTDPATVIAT